MQPDNGGRNAPLGFEHRRSTRSQGVYELLQLAGVLVILVIAYRLFFHPWVWQLGFSAFVIITGTLATALTGHALWQIVRNREFVCRLDGEIIECIAPDRTSGNSFRLRIADIAKIEKTTQLEATWWYLRDRDGNRHWLTSNYGNPVHKFLSAIEEINPAVIEVEVPS